jgi:DMSO/TMAO reductase YedYZ molybdopterin-dependent catalytic subunit
MSDSKDHPTPSLITSPEWGRRRLLVSAGALAVLGGLYVVLDDHPAYAQKRPDGRPRVPPGQSVISKLKDMGGQEGDGSLSKFRLDVHGAVDQELHLDFAALRKFEQVKALADVHCVTGWTVLDAEWVGVRVAELAKRAGVNKSARYVIFEAAHGYTANVPLREALRGNAMVVYRLDGKRLPNAHGGPVRGLLPDLYFWKSAKWLTGIRFAEHDSPGYWERRGYHNRADPWKEERYG